MAGAIRIKTWRKVHRPSDECGCQMSTWHIGHCNQYGSLTKHPTHLLRAARLSSIASASRPSFRAFLISFLSDSLTTTRPAPQVCASLLPISFKRAVFARCDLLSLHLILHITSSAHINPSLPTGHALCHFRLQNKLPLTFDSHSFSLAHFI